MKKILFSLLTSLTMASANAQTVVPVVWGFALASVQGAMVREIINEANTIQNKYQFVFDHRPGAGGAVSVHHTTGFEKPAILAHTSSFFIRPYMEQQGSYDPEKFVMLNNYCVDQPLALISKKYRNLAEFRRQPDVTIGVLPGSITQIFASGYAKNTPQTKVTYVGYKGTPEITTAVLQGELDAGIEFLGSAVRHNGINILAITGNRTHGSYQTLLAQGIHGYEQVQTSLYLMIKKDTDAALISELSEIMSRAVNTDRLRQLCRQDFGEPTNVTVQNGQTIFFKKHQFWQQLIKTLFQ
jgi:tripartite-type tricarboxylate transporter receptor subunit TctC